MTPFAPQASLSCACVSANILLPQRAYSTQSTTPPTGDRRLSAIHNLNFYQRRDEVRPIAIVIITIITVAARRLTLIPFRSTRVPTDCLTDAPSYTFLSHRLRRIFHNDRNCFLCDFCPDIRFLLFAIIQVHNEIVHGTGSTALFSNIIHLINRSHNVESLR